MKLKVQSSKLKKSSKEQTSLVAGVGDVGLSERVNRSTPFCGTLSLELSLSFEL